MTFFDLKWVRIWRTVQHTPTKNSQEYPLWEPLLLNSFFLNISLYLLLPLKRSVYDTCTLPIHLLILIFNSRFALNSRYRPLCSGIRIPGSGKFWPLESRIRESFVCGIRNPGLWNPEYSSRNLESH